MTAKTRNPLTWPDESTGVLDCLRTQDGRYVRKPVHFLNCFGRLALFFFGLQVVTGVLLAVYYVATPAEAHASVEYIQREVVFGSLIRGMHYWGSTALVMMLAAHAIRVFLSGAYKPPREFSWVVGVVLLAITLSFVFSGYLLPWEQKAYWATQLSTSMVGLIPGIGSFLTQVVRGGGEVSGVTLGRFYAVHTLLLPAIACVLLAAHWLIARKQAIIAPL